jgi:carboxymethylenebutenolidase
VAHFDADCRAGLDWLAAHPRVAPAKIGVVGFCIGGHLAFRAAFQPDVRVTVCYYGTGIHDGKLGQDADAGSLARAKEIRGNLLMIFGTKDPHVPDAGRETIDRILRDFGLRCRTLLYPAEHAFTRDEGPRFDPEAADQSFAEMIRAFREAFSS